MKLLTLALLAIPALAQIPTNVGSDLAAIQSALTQAQQDNATQLAQIAALQTQVSQLQAAQPNAAIIQWLPASTQQQIIAIVAANAKLPAGSPPENFAALVTVAGALPNQLQIVTPEPASPAKVVGLVAPAGTVR